MRKGKLIALYGIPKAGVTTQADILVQTYKRKDYHADYLKYPLFKYEPTGEFLNDFLNRGKHDHITERELQMWFTLNRLQAQNDLKETVESGSIVVAESYTGMSLAYGMLAGVKNAWLNSLNEPIKVPDISIVITSERAIEQAHVKSQKTLRKLQEIYLKLAAQHAWYKVNGDQKMMEVHVAIWDIVKKVL